MSFSCVGDIKLCDNDKTKGRKKKITELVEEKCTGIFSSSEAGDDRDEEMSSM